MKIVVIGARAYTERENHLARVGLLVHVGYLPSLEKIDQSFGQHFGMHAKIALPAVQQLCTDCIGHAADTDLQT